MSEPSDPTTPGTPGAAGQNPAGPEQGTNAQPGYTQPGYPQAGNPPAGNPQYGGQPQYGQQYPDPQQQYTGQQPQQAAPGYYGETQYSDPQYGQPSYGQPQQYAQPQYGTPSFGSQQPYAAQQPPFAPGQSTPEGQFGDQFASMTKQSRGPGLRTALIGGVGALVLIGAILLITAFWLPGWAPKSLSQSAVQDGVKQILTKDYQADNVSNVSCPTGQSASKGHTFTCSVTIGGQQQQVKVTVLDDDGKYEVARPTS